MLVEIDGKKTGPQKGCRGISIAQNCNWTPEWNKGEEPKGVQKGIHFREGTGQKPFCNLKRREGWGRRRLHHPLTNQPG